MGSIPTRSRHARHARHALAVLWALAAGVAPLRAQVVDSARVGASALPHTDTLPSSLARPASVPPISPKKALFRSLLIPGWGQASLDRGTAGAIFVGVEFMSIGMLAQSKAQLRAAQRAAGDSLWDATQAIFVVNPLAQVVGKRQAAVEDWAVLLIFNHLISAADAFVAAHLWNVPIEVSGSPANRQANISTRISW